MRATPETVTDAATINRADPVLRNIVPANTLRIDTDGCSVGEAADLIAAATDAAPAG